MSAFQTIGIIGSGAWGTALANAISASGRQVTLYARDPAAANEMAKSRTNASRLAGIALAHGVNATSRIGEAADTDAILLAVPTEATRSAAASLGSLVKPSIPLIACAKGIEQQTGKFVTEILNEAVPLSPAAILSGPSFASDVGKGLPTAVTLAAQDERLAARLAEALSSTAFRLYHSTDVRGVEIGGAAKNVLAIAAGIVVGRGLGASAQAALTTRGFAELMRLGRAYNVKTETLTGLSGLGDLILTCSSPQSRNFALGVAIGRGQSPADARKKSLAEGAFTAPILLEIARKKNVEMPIVEAVAAIIAGKAQVDVTVTSLLSRPLKAES